VTVEIREVFKRLDHHNPVSGHRWTDHGPTTSYEIVGPLGVCAKARTEAGAQRKRDEWQAYYDNLKGIPCSS
jgi:hypothetical protein